MSPRVGLVLNARAGGRGRPTIDVVREAFADTATEIAAVAGPDIRAAAERLLQSGCDVLVAGGGDGTVSTVARTAMGAGVPLGVLPLGTLNHFARDLGIPQRLDEAAAVVTGGVTRAVDAAEAGGLLFLNNASLGVYPRLIQLRERLRAHGTGRWLAALWATLAVLRRHPFLDLTLNTGSEEVRTRTPFVLIANNPYRMSGLQPHSRERLDGGELAVYTYQAHRRLGLLRLGLSVVLLGIDRVRELDVRMTRAVGVSTRRRDPRFALDGELTSLQPPVSARILPRALTVFVPAGPNK